MCAWEQNRVYKQNVLIISDNGDFARDVLAHWQIERQLPAFTLVTTEMGTGPKISSFDLVVVGPVQEGLRKLLQKLGSSTTPLICVVPPGVNPRTLPVEGHAITLLRESESWVENLVVLAIEILRRMSDQARLRRAEALAAANHNQAALGRYMQEMRHSFNNALTSVLGNAELVLLNGDKLRGEIQEQVGTIRDQALNLHEMMQRFTSLELELQCREPNAELPAKIRAASAGAYDA